MIPWRKIDAITWIERASESNTFKIWNTWCRPITQCQTKPKDKQQKKYIHSATADTHRFRKCFFCFSFWKHHIHFQSQVKNGEGDAQTLDFSKLFYQFVSTVLSATLLLFLLSCFVSLLQFCCNKSFNKMKRTHRESVRERERDGRERQKKANATISLIQYAFLNVLRERGKETVREHADDGTKDHHQQTN